MKKLFRLLAGSLLSIHLLVIPAYGAGSGEHKLSE